MRRRQRGRRLTAIECNPDHREQAKGRHELAEHMRHSGPAVLGGEEHGRLEHRMSGRYTREASDDLRCDVEGDIRPADAALRCISKRCQRRW
jgi:hypothetical protein